MSTEQDTSETGRAGRRRNTKRGNGEGSVYYDDRLKLWRATVQLGGANADICQERLGETSLRR
jgi:hypothetical protein